MCGIYWHLISRKKNGLKLLHSTPLPPITIQRLLCSSRTFSTSLTHLRHVFRRVRRAPTGAGHVPGGGEFPNQDRRVSTVDQLNISPTAWQSSDVNFEFLELQMVLENIKSQTQFCEKGIHLRRLIEILRRQNATNSSAKVIPVGMQGNGWYMEILSEII